MVFLILKSTASMNSSGDMHGKLLLAYMQACQRPSCFSPICWKIITYQSFLLIAQAKQMTGWQIHHCLAAPFLQNK